MEARHTKKLFSRLTSIPCTHRPFTTHTPRLLVSYPPAPPPPPPPPATTANKPAPYYSPRRKNDATFKLAASLVDESAKRNALTRVAQYDHKQRAIAELEKSNRAKDLERQQSRKWKVGDVYAPHDLSPVEMGKWRVRRRAGRDVFDMLGINPLMEYKNFSMMSEYMTNMGRIRHRNDTGLRAVNQRKIAKAIRRAVGMGLLPSVHKHPEMLEVEAKERNMRKWVRGTGQSSGSKATGF